MWRWRGASAARPFYEALDASTLDDDEARTLIIKRAMVDRGGLRAEVFRDLLIGRGELDPSPTSAMARLGLDPLASNDPWAAYLAGRQLFLAERFVPALEALRVGDVATLGESRVLAEVQRMRAIAMYRNGDLAEAAAAFSALAEDSARPTVPRARSSRRRCRARRPRGRGAAPGRRRASR